MKCTRWIWTINGRTTVSITGHGKKLAKRTPGLSSVLTLNKRCMSLEISNDFDIWLCRAVQYVRICIYNCIYVIYNNLHFIEGKYLTYIVEENHSQNQSNFTVPITIAFPAFINLISLHFGPWVFSQNKTISIEKLWYTCLIKIYIKSMANIFCLSIIFFI